jgi:hypothetical protein
MAWPLIDQAAYYGLAGDVVRAIEPHSEADPNGILIQLLAAVGNACTMRTKLKKGLMRSHGPRTVL